MLVLRTSSPPPDLYLSFKINLLNFCEDYGPHLAPQLTGKITFLKTPQRGWGAKT